MSTDIIRPALVLGILLAAGFYAAAKEWQWEAAATIVPVAQIERTAAPVARVSTWHTEAVTVRAAQIFQD